MAVVGIDLGTTYSVIATPQKFDGKYFETLRGVTLIKDDFNQRLTPSVVAMDRQGNLLVGRRAKARAGMRPAPIMHVKRSMGEATEFALGEQSLRPEEVSAEILRYLKEMAEKQMGEQIEEAVITVPAYFTNLQKQKTKEAGEKAGLSVGDPLQEPVAAALAYFSECERDPLTIMTYDLGGGTFDVAILRKERGVFDIKSFDGDRHLGGYDFDKRLADWIVDRLNEQGYQLRLNLESPEYHKLLILAEMAKTKLTDYESYALMEPNTGIQDANGEPVTVDVEITRETFERLIEDYVDETVRLCRKAMQKADPPIDPRAIDEIVLVGGSSRIPMITRRLKAEFGCQPQLTEPDLSVAIGAAIMARRLSRRIGVLKLSPLPESTGATTIQVTGTLEKSAQLPDVSGCAVALTSADGSLSRRETVDEGGGFLFLQVPLTTDAINVFSLRVEDADGREVLTHRFTVRHETGGALTQLQDGFESNVLAKPISIMTTTGLRTVAPERTELPHECHVSARTTDQEGEVRVPVYEDTYQIGEIVVEAVPTDLPIGSRVDITLTLRTDFYIDGSARIPAAGAESQTTIQIPLVVIKSLAELQDEYFTLKGQVDEALAQADPAQAFAIAPRLRTALSAAQKLLYKERNPNLAKAQEVLAEVETLIGQLSSWQPDPPPERFERVRQEIEDELLPALYDKKPAAADGSYEGQLKAIAQMGDDALKKKNGPVWADADRRLNDLRESVLAALAQAERQERRDRREEPPDPRAIKLKLGMHLAQLREETRRQNRLAELEADFHTCDQALKEIDAGASDAMARLVDYYENLHQPLQARAVGVGIRKEGVGLTEVDEVLSGQSRG